MIDRIIERTGATFVSPYDDENVVLGQGTLALEFEEHVTALTERAGWMRSSRRVGAAVVLFKEGGNGMWASF